MLKPFVIKTRAYGFWKRLRFRLTGIKLYWEIYFPRDMVKTGSSQLEYIRDNLVPLLYDFDYCMGNNKVWKCGHIPYLYLSNNECNWLGLTFQLDEELDPYEVVQ